MSSFTRGAGRDVPCDVAGVPAYPAHVLGCERALEVQADEVQTRRGGNAAFVYRFGVVEDRSLDPAEVLVEAGVPDHVGGFDDPAVLQQRQTSAYADGPGNSLDAGGGEIPTERPA